MYKRLQIAIVNFSILSDSRTLICKSLQFNCAESIVRSDAIRKAIASRGGPSLPPTHRITALFARSQKVEWGPFCRWFGRVEQYVKVLPARAPIESIHVNRKRRYWSTYVNISFFFFFTLVHHVPRIVAIYYAISGKSRMLSESNRRCSSRQNHLDLRPRLTAWWRFFGWRTYGLHWSKFREDFRHLYKFFDLRYPNLLAKFWLSRRALSSFSTVSSIFSLFEIRTPTLVEVVEITKPIIRTRFSIFSTNLLMGPGRFA